MSVEQLIDILNCFSVVVGISTGVVFWSAFLRRF